jgi:spermidine/putrescine transport system permease protein
MLGIFRQGSKWLIAGIVFLYSPLLLSIAHSFGGFDNLLGNYAALLQGSDFMKAILLSLYIAILATSISTFISAILAISLRNSTRIWRVLLFSYTTLPDIVVALSLLNAFTALGLKVGFSTLVLSYTIIATSFSTFYLLQAFDVTRDQDRVLEEAAQDLGASKVSAALHILTPRIRAVIGFVGCYLISSILDDVVLVGLLSGSVVTTAPVLILSMMRQGTDPRLNAFTAIILILVATTTILYGYLSKTNPRSPCDTT